MAGIEDLIKVYRGERHTTYGGLNEAKKISSSLSPYHEKAFGRWFTTEKDWAERYSRAKGNYKRKLFEAKISKKDFDLGRMLKSKVISGESLAKVKAGIKLGLGDPNLILLPKKNLKDVKVIESNLVRDGLDVKKGRVKLTARNIKANLLKTFISNAKALTPLAAKGLSVLVSLPVATLTMVLQSTPANEDETNMQLEDFAKLAEENNLEIGSNMDKALPERSRDI
jgi:hypothetical protein